MEKPEKKFKIYFEMLFNLANVMLTNIMVIIYILNKNLIKHMKCIKMHKKKVIYLSYIFDLENIFHLDRTCPTHKIQ